MNIIDFSTIKYREDFGLYNSESRNYHLLILITKLNFYWTYADQLNDLLLSAQRSIGESTPRYGILK